MCFDSGCYSGRVVRVSVLQCVAVFGSVLQSCFICECTLMADVSGRVVRMSVLQYVAVCCSCVLCLNML